MLCQLNTLLLMSQKGTTIKLHQCIAKKDASRIGWTFLNNKTGE